MINVRSVANNVMHFKHNVRLVETSSGQWCQHVYKIFFRGSENELLSIFSIQFKSQNDRVKLKL